MRRFLPRPSHIVHRYRNFDALWPRFFMLLAAFALAMVWVRVATATTPNNLLGPTLTATVAAASLIYSLGRGQEASKDQYTLTLISRRFDDGDYAANVRVARELRLAGVITPATELKALDGITWADPRDDDKRQKAIYAIIPILNYWEHVCTAYVDDRINRRIFEDLVQDLIREMVGRYPRIIGDMRREDSSNMEHLCTVWFVLATPDERRKNAAALGPVPARLCPHDQWLWGQAAH